MTLIDSARSAWGVSDGVMRAPLPEEHDRMAVRMCKLLHPDKIERLAAETLHAHLAERGKRMHPISEADMRDFLHSEPVLSQIARYSEPEKLRYRQGVENMREVAHQARYRAAHGATATILQERVIRVMAEKNASASKTAPLPPAYPAKAPAGSTKPVG